MTALSMTRGDDESFDVVVRRRRVPPATQGVPIDITGMALRFTAKRRLRDADADAVITKTTGAGITTTNATDGEARIDIDAADTEDLTQTTKLTWDLQGKDNTGKVRTLAKGRFTIELDVSRTAP